MVGKVKEIKIKAWHKKNKKIYNILRLDIISSDGKKFEGVLINPITNKHLPFDESEVDLFFEDFIKIDYLKNKINKLKEKIKNDQKLTLNTSKLKTNFEESKIIEKNIHKIENKIYEEINKIIDNTFKKLVDNE